MSDYPSRQESSRSFGGFLSPRVLGAGMQSALVLLLVLLVALTCLNSPGTEDMTRWLLYMELAHKQGSVASYQTAALTGVGGATTDYPPLSFAILGVSSRLGAAAGISDFIALKLSLTCFTLACAGILAFWQGRWRPIFALAAFLSLTLDALLQGYLDVYFAVFLLLSFLCLERGYLQWGAVLFTVSFLTKWQPIILSPLLLLYMLPERVKPAQLVRFAPAVAVLIGVYTIFGDAMPLAFAHGLSDMRLSGKALNLDWLITALAEAGASEFRDGLVITLWFDHAPRLTTGIFPYLTAISSALRYLCYFVALASFYLSDRGFPAFVECSVACFLAYFVFGHGVHENHMFVPALLGLCWLAIDRSRCLEAALLLLMFNINLFIFYGSTGHGLGYMRVIGGWDVTIFLSAFNLILFAVLWSPVAIHFARRVARANSSRRANPVRSG
jgi:hypothetical protein